MIVKVAVIKAHLEGAVLLKASTVREAYGKALKSDKETVSTASSRPTSCYRYCRRAIGTMPSACLKGLASFKRIVYTTVDVRFMFSEIQAKASRLLMSMFICCYRRSSSIMSCSMVRTLITFGSFLPIIFNLILFNVRLLKLGFKLKRERGLWFGPCKVWCC